jgi:proline iminopeptidase
MQIDSYTNKEMMLSVGDGYKLFVTDWGNVKAKTKVIFLHGGPGGTVKDKHLAAFDPELHHVIFFNQRGSDKSTPTGSLKNNTTQHMIEDISKIAKKFKFDKFYLHGSSWGSTLALAYSLAHPEKVRGLVIGGVFTGSKAECDWIDNGEFRTFYPEVWQAYLERTPEKFRDDPTAYHFDKALNGKAKERKASAYAYECLEAGAIKLDDRFMPDNFDEYDPAKIRVEIHYLANNCFMPDRYILDNAHKLTMPVWIVQGRYDMVCPPITAYELHHKLPNSRIYWTIAGHGTEHESENVFRAIFAGLAA